MTRRRILALLFVALVAGMAYLTLWPVPIDPAAWTPPQPPALTGQYAPNSLLDQTELLLPGIGVGPEDILAGNDGSLYTGFADGRIIQFDPVTMQHSVFANTGGRPLGLVWDAQLNMIVADAHNGLLSIDPAGTISVLTVEEGGVPFGFTDDVDVAQDGTIYFTDATWKFHAPNYMADLLENQPNGRFLSYDPKTKQTIKLIGDLYFANGVAISPDQTYVLVNETWRFRVLRYWLAGEKKGTWDVFIDNLPGFPDNISSNGKGTFWLALANPRNKQAEVLAPYPFARKVLWRMPRAVWPKVVRFGFVLGLDSAGKVVHNLQGPAGVLAPVTSAVEIGDFLYMGSVEDSKFGRLTLSAVGPRPQ